MKKVITMVCLMSSTVFAGQLSELEAAKELSKEFSFQNVMVVKDSTKSEDSMVVSLKNGNCVLVKGKSSSSPKKEYIKTVTCEFLDADLRQ